MMWSVCVGPLCGSQCPIPTDLFTKQFPPWTWTWHLITGALICLPLKLPTWGFFITEFFKIRSRLLSHFLMVGTVVSLGNMDKNSKSLSMSWMASPHGPLADVRSASKAGLEEQCQHFRVWRSAQQSIGSLLSTSKVHGPQRPSLEVSEKQIVDCW